PVAVSAMSLLSPVTAVVLGWIFLGQKIRGMALMGLMRGAGERECLSSARRWPCRR
ncbi:EamA family transporter, partial [Klebsiella pneumoniae]